MFKRIFILLSAVSILSACSSAPVKPASTTRGDYEYTRKYLAWLIEKEMKKNDVTGLSIALVDDQQVVWAQGFGYADVKGEIPATPETVYQLGSIAKLFTATAAMQLAEQDKINIDKPFVTYLPEFSIKSRFPDAAPVTPRNILSHHSGLPANWVNGMCVRNPGSFTKVVDEIKDEYLAYPPNYVFSYSSLGMTLLGTALERVSGEDFAGYMENHLLRPMGMSHTSFTTKPTAKSYNNGEEIEAFPLRDLPSSGLNSSALDMSRFMKMLFADGRSGENQILKPETLAEMFKPQNANTPLDLDLHSGLGWLLTGMDIPNAGPVAHHGGTTLNFQSMAAVLPEHKLGVIVMSNTASSHFVVSQITTAALQLALEAKTGIRQPAKSKIEAQPIPLTREAANSYSGNFDTLVGLVKVSGDDGELEAELFGKTFQLVPRKDGQFGLKYKLLGLIPISIAQLDEVNLSLVPVEGKDVLAIKTNDQSVLLGEKLKPVTPSKNLLDYVGEYEPAHKIDGPFPEKISLKYEDGILVGECTLPQVAGLVFRQALTPVSDSEAVVAGLGNGKGDTVKMFRVGNEKHLRISGVDLRMKTALTSTMQAKQETDLAPVK